MNIEHDTINKRIFVVLNSAVAYVEYTQTKSTFEVTHTRVPIELTGKGIASSLMQYSFDYAKSRGLQFSPSCHYAQIWLDKNHFNKSPKEL